LQRRRGQIERKRTFGRSNKFVRLELLPKVERVKKNEGQEEKGDRREAEKLRSRLCGVIATWHRKDGKGKRAKTKTEEEEKEFKKIPGSRKGDGNEQQDSDRGKLVG